MSPTRHEHEEIAREVFDDEIVQLAAICPLCALSALSPAAALAALSPMLRIFNPAVNPNAALLSFASQASLLLALQQALQRQRLALFHRPILTARK